MNRPDDDPPCTLGDASDGPLPACAEGLIAATLALMTGYAEHCPAPLASGAGPAPAGRDPTVAHLLAAKAACNLAFLAEQPELSAPLRSILVRLRGHWQALEFRGAPGAGTATPQPPAPCACAPVSAPTLYFSQSTARH